MFKLQIANITIKKKQFKQYYITCMFFIDFAKKNINKVLNISINKS